MGAVEAYEMTARARRLQLPGLISSTGNSAAFEDQVGRSSRVPPEQKGWRQLIAQLVETLGQVIDNGPADAIPDAGGPARAPSRAEKDQRALKAVLERMDTVSSGASSRERSRGVGCFHVATVSP
jgi:hypothetical protein